MVFLEPLQDTNVRESHCAAAFQGHADFGPWPRRGVLLRARCARPQKQQKNENNAAHAGLLSGPSKSLNSQMFNEFGAARRFQQARMEASGTFVFLQDVASIDDEDLSGDVRRFRRSKETNRGGDFVGRAGAAERRMKRCDFFGLRR